MTNLNKVADKITSLYDNRTVYGIYDGETLLFVAEKRSKEDYDEEKECNEMFSFCEVFTTVKGHQYIYWRDEEIDADYITKLK